MRDAGIERPVTYVLTRERVRATNRWRADPEWRIVREIDVPFAQDVDVDATVRARPARVGCCARRAARDHRPDGDGAPHRRPGCRRVGGGRRRRRHGVDHAVQRGRRRRPPRRARRPRDAADPPATARQLLARHGRAVDPGRSRRRIAGSAARRRRRVDDRRSGWVRCRAGDDRDRRGDRADDSRSQIRRHGRDAGSDQRGRQHRPQLAALRGSTPVAATISSPSTERRCPVRVAGSLAAAFDGAALDTTTCSGAGDACRPVALR